MDVPAPALVDYASPLPTRPARPLALIGIATTAILAGTLVGATTNAINGAVSPTYFINVMGWDSTSSIWQASVIQGVLEGSVVGLLFSAILTITVGIVTRATCTYRMGLQWLGWIVLAIYGLWAVGGIGGVWLASSAPQFYQNAFLGVPSDHDQMVRFGWVGGSIWGVEFGGLLAVIVGLVLFRIKWRRMLKSQNGTPWR